MTANILPLSDIPALMREMARQARSAYTLLAEAPNAQKDLALAHAAQSLRKNAEKILRANAEDMKLAEASGMDAAMLDRLKLNEARVEAMAVGLETIVTVPDPINKVIDQWERPNGLTIQRVSIPLGVIGIIYESRPNVTADAAGLCIKSGNAAILRGGSDSLHSSAAILECLHEGLRHAGLPSSAAQLVPVKDREAVGEMLTLNGLIDVIIPRGGKGLCERVQKESRVPTLLHLDGNCHTYIHEKADVEMAAGIVKNAKLRRTGICGATESLLIDKAVAQALLPSIADMLAAEGCEMRGDEAARDIDARILPATEADWAAEYLGKVISIKVVSGLEEAIAHINTYGSHHTDAIVTADVPAARRFLRQVDSAIVMHNASTQFADGGEFGFGAEIGIATGRLHARGPVGAEQLTTYKYVVHGAGQLRP